MRDEMRAKIPDWDKKKTECWMFVFLIEYIERWFSFSWSLFYHSEKPVRYSNQRRKQIPPSIEDFFLGGPLRLGSAVAAVNKEVPSAIQQNWSESRLVTLVGFGV